MAINKNHEFEELNGVKCAIVEKNASPDRVNFLKALLELNKFTVIVVPSAPPKAIPVPPPANPTTELVPDVPKLPEAPPPPETFTIGVTDVSFNSTNAIFGRLLKTKEGRIVTLAYWQQKEVTSNDEVPYFEKKEV